jgi:hypothetical protein
LAPRAPDWASLLAVSSALTAAGVSHALGGSGLLQFLGADIEANDWDITTDAPESDVTGVVRRFAHRRLERIPPFESEYAYKLSVGSGTVDLLGGFAVFDGHEVVRCRTIVTGYRDGVPLGSPSEWAKMYRALGDDAKWACARAVRS